MGQLTLLPEWMQIVPCDVPRSSSQVTHETCSELEVPCGLSPRLLLVTALSSPDHPRAEPKAWLHLCGADMQGKLHVTSDIVRT